MQAVSVADEPRVSVTTAEKAMQAVEFGKPAGTAKKVFWSQHVASVTLSLVMFLVGLANGWSSPYLAQLSLQDEVDGIPRATDKQLSWVATLMNFGRIFGAMAGAVAQDTVGRKMSLCFAGFPLMCGWTCIAVAVSVEWLYAARILCGFAMGMIWTTLSLYLSEIADPEIRGSLVLWNITTQSIGVFLGNLMGPYISMKVYAYISLVPNVLFLLLFPLIPDSPYRLIMIGNLDKAEKSLRWFRRRQDVKQELLELQDYVSTSKVSLVERLKEFKEARYRRSFLMMFLINIFSYFGAFNVINNYMEIIVTKSQVSITPSIIVTVTGGFSILSGLLSTFLVDSLGRRFLLIGSSLGMALSLTALGLHFQLLDLGYDPVYLTWLPCIILLVYTVSYSAGCGCIPSALVGELFSPRLKTIASLSFSGTSAVFSTMSTGSFVPFLNLVGPSYLFWFYSVGIYVSVIYYWYFVPETMGKSLQAIQTESKK
ncbi:facilitated trehalose transporter Tret1-like [Nasonia vitripennis]|uniref:Major facilitator superfamily (MFS) profile domain-containing protein n=1 Tax=Nasonia vitripennis TaxID=7425 RepID=A0A7M7PZW9_NASVI|nr:facilitated trehalose transporter Tret1-like [Nasonia vitripennis]